MPSPKTPVSPKPESLAKAPFDDARADLILQSSDGVHFHIFKNILSLSSPIFSDMFNIPSSLSPKDHAVPVVPLSEHSTALDIALRHIYPVQFPTGDILHYASILAEFGRKYQVEMLDRFVIFYLKDYIERDPLGVYAIAVTYGYSNIGKSAAQLCLNIPLSGLESPYLRCATVEHISELLRYHAACGKAASAIASSDRAWFSSLVKNGIFARPACRLCSMGDFVSPSHGGA